MISRTRKAFITNDIEVAEMLSNLRSMKDDYITEAFEEVQNWYYDYDYEIKQPKYRHIKITNLIGNDDVITITSRVEPNNGKLAGSLLVSSIVNKKLDVPCKNKRWMNYLHNDAIKYYKKRGYDEYQI